MKVALGVAVVGLAGCATFEDPSIVVDLRVLAMTMIPGPERVIDLDLQGPPPTLDDVRLKLLEWETPVVCALVADPATARDLRYSMRVCLPDDNHRCDPAKPEIPIADGEILYDPEVWQGGALTACHEIPVDDRFVTLLYESLKAAPQSALVGIDYEVEMRIGRENQHPEYDVFAVKHGRVSARVPETRLPNQNPGMRELQISAPTGAPFIGGPRPCSQPFGDLFVVQPGTQVTLYPVEIEGSRETFVVPTLDGEFVEYTEYHDYQWLSSRGSFSDEITGGPPDLLGNEKLLGTDWTAPSAAEVGGGTDVPIWVIQRDDRYGVTWWETCIRVEP